MLTTSKTQRSVCGARNFKDVRKQSGGDMSSPTPQGAPATTAIAVTGLRKSYGEHLVLDGIDLTVRQGTVFALLGPNGAGKTTMVQILSTLIRADGGEVQVAGHDVAA